MARIVDGLDLELDDLDSADEVVDDEFICSNTIDVLIGLDFYYEIVSDKRVKCEGGPLAIGSKFSYILCSDAKLNKLETLLAKTFVQILI